jgi:hypothetical protein
MDILRKKGVPCPKELVGRRGDATNETEPSLIGLCAFTWFS